MQPVDDPRGREQIKVKYFKPDESNLVALVERFCVVSRRFPVWLELIVSRGKDGLHLIVEQISGVT